MLLAGDIGGTKTNLAVYSSAHSLHAPSAEETFPSGAFESLEEVIAAFLSRVDGEITCVSLGVAGPVIDNRVEITNLPWSVDGRRLSEAIGVESVSLINDLAATAMAIPVLNPDDIHTLRTGSANAEGPIAVIAPGTGLGEAYLTWSDGCYHTHPSEGGHADFAPSDELQAAMLDHCRVQFGHVSVERVCSGMGIANIYRFLKETGHGDEPDWLTERLRNKEDPVPVIVDTALDPSQSCELCVATLRMFVSILGAEAGNYALKLLATGGVYLGGGIPPRILPLLAGDEFLAAFQHKGRMADFLSQLPIYVILNPKAALLGAAHHGFEQWNARKSD